MAEVTAQKEQLRNVAESKGFNTLTSFIRHKLFDGDLGTHHKLNQILNMLGQKQESFTIIKKTSERGMQTTACENPKRHKSAPSHSNNYLL